MNQTELTECWIEVLHQHHFQQTEIRNWIKHFDFQFMTATLLAVEDFDHVTRGEWLLEEFMDGLDGNWVGK